MRFRFWLSVVGVMIAWGVVADGRPTVRIDGGMVSGIETGGVTAFKGIRYAAAPVGEWRWKPPQPVQAWGDVKAADSFGPTCVQPPYLPTSIYFQPAQPQSEDCLFLNLWTAAKAGEKRPVMVWIHGGAFTRGAGSLSAYDGTALARKGVVLVTINYRLGALGFFAHPGLSAESPHHASGNYAILDIIAALKWVQTNIAEFGGDRSRVTIFGESAGSWAVHALQASPLARGLFHRAIGESGGEFDEDRNLKIAEETGLRLATALSATSLAALRAIPAEKVVGVQQPGSRLTVDGFVLTDNLRTTFERRAHNVVPVIVGSNANEMTTLTDVATLPKTLDDFRRRVETQYRDVRGFDAVYPVRSETEIVQALLDAGRDSLFTLQMRTWARLNGQKAYLYQFTRAPQLTDRPGLGAFHASEIAFVFNNVELRPWVTPIDLPIAERISSYWVNFARTGDPNGRGLPKWTPYSLNTEPYLELGEQAQPKYHLLKPQLDFLEAESRRTTND